MFSSTVSFSYLRYSLAKQLYPLMGELLPLSRKETFNESYTERLLGSALVKRWTEEIRVHFNIGKALVIP